MELRLSKCQCIQESKNEHSEWTIFHCISVHHTSNSSSGTISKNSSSALSSSWLWHLHTSYLVPRPSDTKVRRNCGQARSPQTGNDPSSQACCCQPHLRDRANRGIWWKKQRAVGRSKWIFHSEVTGGEIPPKQTKR